MRFRDCTAYRRHASLCTPGTEPAVTPTQRVTKALVLLPCVFVFLPRRRGRRSIHGKVRRTAPDSRARPLREGEGDGREKGIRGESGVSLSREAEKWGARKHIVAYVWRKCRRLRSILRFVLLVVLEEFVSKAGFRMNVLGVELPLDVGAAFGEGEGAAWRTMCWRKERQVPSPLFVVLFCQSLPCLFVSVRVFDAAAHQRREPLRFLAARLPVSCLAVSCFLFPNKPDP